MNVITGTAAPWNQVVHPATEEAKEDTTDATRLATATTAAQQENISPSERQDAVTPDEHGSSTRLPTKAPERAYDNPYHKPRTLPRDESRPELVHLTTNAQGHP